jgi:hypothetical protein
MGGVATSRKQAEQQPHEEKDIGGSQDNAVSKVTRLWAGWSRVQILARKTGFFSSPKRPVQLWGTASLLFNGHWGFSSRGKVATVLH